MRILVCEDQKDLNKIITKHLTAEGYSADSCYDGQEALDFMDMADYDAVILDVMMPKKDGFAVLREMRSVKNATPVLFLTARDSIEDRVRAWTWAETTICLSLFLLRCFWPWIRAMTRKAAGNASNIFTAADLTLDVSSRSCRRGEKGYSTFSQRVFSPRISYEKQGPGSHQRHDREQSVELRLRRRHQRRRRIYTISTKKDGRRF